MHTGAHDEPDRPAHVVTYNEWLHRRAAHQARVDALLADHLDRRRRGVPHPVEDFLFTYYSYRPAQMRRWHPGSGVYLAGAGRDELGPGYRIDPAGLTVDVPAVLSRTAPHLHFALAVLTGTAARSGQFGCFGLHEWAMVYRRPLRQIRHPAVPLRLSPAQIANVVEGSQLRCTHADAYRFFSDPARPRNAVQPTRHNQQLLEQPACLHANMDLYKWAYKLSPLVPSELVADCFELARDIRALDMRASPYDLTAMGYSPVRVETVEGRQEYAQAQRSFAERAAPLRTRLMAACDRLLNSVPP